MKAKNSNKMTEKRHKPIPEKKVQAVEELKKLLKNNKTFLVASIKDLPGSQYQEVVKKMRKNAVVKVPKKNLIFRAIEESGITGLKEIEPQINGSVALIFSKEDSFDLAAELLESKSPAKARPGQIAPEDISVEAGPTELMPGPAISELGALGIQIQIEGGKISIKAPKVIAKKGEAISEKAADVMAKLDIKPFSIGFIPLAAFDTQEKKLYSEMKINREEAIKALKEAYGRALPFAVSRGYASDDTIRLLISKAHAHANKVHRIMTGEPEPEVASPAHVEEVKEEKKEESKAAAAEGLSSLFG